MQQVQKQFERSKKDKPISKRISTRVQVAYKTLKGTGGNLNEASILSLQANSNLMQLT